MITPNATFLLNGDIVTDSDSDDSEQYLGLENVTNERAKDIILKKRKL